MQPSRPIVLALALAALAAAVWLYWQNSAAPPPLQPPAGGAGAGGGLATGELTAGPETVTPAAESAGDRREQADRTPVPAAGATTLRVTALWPDAQPAAGVTLYLRRGERFLPYTAFAHRLTDEAGVAVFADVRPGTVRLFSDRGDKKKVEIAPGVHYETFELQGGVAVTCTVRDPEAAPVAGAEVWLQTSDTTWSGGRVVGVTGTDGICGLEHVDPGHSLAAVAAGFAPSALVDLDDVDTNRPPVALTLTLRPDGGELAGQVTDAAGAPVADAMVAAGTNPAHLDTRGEEIREHWTVRTAATDPAGRFVIRGLASGPTKVAVRAGGFGLWREEVTIRAGATTTIAPQLAASAVLLGTVTETDGRPISGARVSAYDQEPRTPFLAGGQIDFDETFGYRGALTDEQGAYRIDGVTPGTVHAFAQRPHAGWGDGVSIAYTRAALEVAPGSTTSWDPVIDDGRQIEGIVLYRDGYPMPGLFVTLADEHGEMEHVIVSDRQGVFRFLCLQDTTYEIRVQLWDAPKGQPPLGAKGVAPDGGRVELRVDYDKPVEQARGVVVGRIDDAGHRISNPQAAYVMLSSDQRWFRDGGKIEDGVFRFERVQPCRFRLTLMEGEQALAHSDWFELAPAGTVDIGLLTTEPGGAVRVSAVRSEGAGELEPKLYLKREGDPRSTTVTLGRRDECLVESLTPGIYEVSGHARGMVPLRGTVTVAAGQTAEFTVDVVAGAHCRIEVWWPEGHTGSTRRGYRFRDAEGVTVREFEGGLSTSPTRPYVLQTTLPAGRFELEFWSDDGLRGELDLTVPASLDEVTGRLDLK